MGANFPGQSVNSCGQPSQVASCGSHSAGMRKFSERGVFVDGFGFIGLENLTQSAQGAQSLRVVQHRAQTEVCATEIKSVGKPALQDGLVSVNAAVSEKGPVATLVFAFRRVAFDNQDFFFAVAGFGNYLAVWSSHEGMAPEL